MPDVPHQKSEQKPIISTTQNKYGAPQLGKGKDRGVAKGRNEANVCLGKVHTNTGAPHRFSLLLATISLSCLVCANIVLCKGRINSQLRRQSVWAIYTFTQRARAHTHTHTLSPATPALKKQHVGKFNVSCDVAP